MTALASMPFLVAKIPPPATSTCWRTWTMAAANSPLAQGVSPSACNYDATAVYPATCEFPDAGYDCDGNCLSDSDGDGVCDPFEIQGCTDEEACNFDPEATELDGSCDFDSCAGCTNSFACNYDPDATTDDGSCDYFSCIVFGCTTESACNYDPDATYADGSCEFTSCAGCTNPLACDYDPEATISAQCTDFSSCLGCLDPEACNYDPEATQDGGNCIFLGCTIPAACNYDASATPTTDPASTRAVQVA